MTDFTALNAAAQSLIDAQAAADSTTYTTALAAAVAAKDAVIAADAVTLAAKQAELDAYKLANPDKTPPSVPTGLVATVVSSTQIDLAWNASTDNSGPVTYQVYRGAGQVGSPSAPSYSNTGLTPATAYTFKVRSKDVAGNFSGYSTIVTATTAAAGPPSDTTVPSVPTGLVASNITASSIDLAWTASTDNVAVAGYDVFRNGVQVGSPTGLTFSNTGLTASTAYAFAVRARDAAGNVSANSATINATTAAAGGPPPPGFDPLTLNATNTGFTGTLTAATGMTTSADGQTIQNLDITGRVTVQHKNVTIKNCKIYSDEFYAVFAPDDQGHDVSNLTVDHCTITGAINGIAGKGTFNRNNISKVDNGVNVWGPSLITENYIHDLGSVMSAISKDGHNDGIENNGSPMTLLRNRIEASTQNDTSAVMTDTFGGALTDILIDGNYLSGGQYTLYCDNRFQPPHPVTNFVVTNNTIKKGNFGHTALYNSGVVVGPTNTLI